MKILFDQGTPEPLRKLLFGHEIKTAYEKGFSRLTNGRLLDAAEAEFDLLITTDKNIQFQQNLSGRKLSVIILPTTAWPVIERNVDRIIEAIGALTPATLRVVQFDKD